VEPLDGVGDEPRLGVDAEGADIGAGVLRGGGGATGGGVDGRWGGGERSSSKTRLSEIAVWPLSAIAVLAESMIAGGGVSGLG
jgi:hypothetical protein